MSKKPKIDGVREKGCSPNNSSKLIRQPKLCGREHVIYKLGSRPVGKMQKDIKGVRFQMWEQEYRCRRCRKVFCCFLGRKFQ